MEIYDISIAPGQIRDIFCNGSYVYFYAGSAGGADATITVNQDSRGQRVLLQPGQAYRMPNGDTGTRWLIGNLRGEGTIVGRLLIGSGELTDNRVTGSVEVIDGGKDRTNAGVAFVATFNVVQIAAARSSAVLWNPAGSGKNIFVKTHRFSQTAAGSYGCVLATSLGTGLITDTKHIAPKKRGTVSVAQGWCTNATVFNGTSENTNSFVTAALAANQADNITFSEPILLQPGSGLYTFSGPVNSNIIVTAEYVEESQ